MKYILASFFALVSTGVLAQQNHFIYIQSESQQAFYVKLDKKIMSSSASGYIIISKLKEGDYHFSIGFPKSEWPEQNITCKVGATDDGYLLKNFAEKGWGLFNYQTISLIMADSMTKKDSLKLKNNKENVFANVLSNVVNDPSIIRIAESKERNANEINTNQIKSQVTNLPKNNEALSTIDKSKLNAARPKSNILKLSNSKTGNSENIIYVDEVSGKYDTIHVLITAANPESTISSDNNIIVKKVSDTMSKSVSKVIVPFNDSSAKVIDTVFADKKEKIITAEKSTEKIAGSPNVNNPKQSATCKEFVDDTDYLDLYKEVNKNKDNENEMLLLVFKVSAKKCFNTKQIRGLSRLFSGDMGRYKLFDDTYLHAADPENFSSLELELTDEYYIKRFRAMLR